MSNNASSLPVLTVGFVTGANASSNRLPVLRLDVSEHENDYIIPDRELELIKVALIESLKKAKEPSLTTVSFAVDIPPLPEKRRRRRKESNFSEYEPKSPQPEQKKRKKRNVSNSASNSPQPEQRRRRRKTGKTSEDSSTTATSKSERRLDTDNHPSVFEVLEELIG